MTLQIQQLHHSFGEKKVLSDISFTVEDGQFVSILGPSGSGKSTLFHLIGGILKPESGKILLNNREITNESGHMSYMPQSPSLFPWRTVLQNAMLGSELVGVADEAKTIELLQKANLGEMMEAYPSQLSGGMKQRVAFVRALLSPQPLLCLDEPFSALDSFTKKEMQQWLLKTWEDYDKSILFITHDIEEALFLSDQVIILSTNPATVKASIKIPFQRPRDEQLFLSEEFLHWKRKIVEALQE
ncbi:ABC transporter ATP-binding protein [Metasolibacillus sp.]|uniref:ABC transporter ATP-binding protein n=1 Tax=Metasolibacillus sp. TaxID=2703680 RepID=UPI0025FEEC73|nr:ABC transporter ATP-binding protein [Metasolibacillus sp.]MCT6926273.1 ABC transporter ATP-binding protein [Metasolibacillus sp.]MCT6942514.1 ABC transporter ATP-binding protein [Metasolibacillus sp.]